MARGRPSKRQRDDDGEIEGHVEDPPRVSAVHSSTLCLQIAAHHSAITKSWLKDSDDAIAQEVRSLLANPHELALASMSLATDCGRVVVKNGAWRNVAVPLPGEGVVYATVTVSSMVTADE